MALRRVAVSLIAASLSIATSIVHAEELEIGSDKWAPMLGFSVGLSVQDLQGTSTSSQVQPPSFFPAPGPIRPATRGDERTYGATIGMDLGVMTPRVADAFGSPRFFAHANVEANTASDTITSQERSRGPIRFPVDAFLTPQSEAIEGNILGQGTQTIVDFDPLQVRAGAGVAFSFVLYERRLRIKPSFEYVYKKMDNRGGVSRVVGLDGRNDGTRLLLRRFFFATDARIIGIDVPMTTTLHGIGPGLEIEMDAWRAGPNIISVFFGFNAYRYLGSLKDTATGFGDNPLENTTFRFKFEPWAYRANVGARFRWQPE